LWPCNKLKKYCDIELCLQEDQPKNSDITNKSDIIAFDNTNFSTSSIYIYILFYYIKNTYKMYAIKYMNQFDGLASLDYGGPAFDGSIPQEVISTAVFSRDAGVDQNVSSGVLVNLAVFSGSNSVNNMGTVPISLDANNFTFRNTGSYKTAFEISYSITWIAHSGNSGIKQAWIAKNLNFNDRYGFVTLPQSSNHTQITAASATLVLEPNETFGIRLYQNTGSTMQIDGASIDKSRIQITQIK
jgi:hypothetical protein